MPTYMCKLQGMPDFSHNNMKTKECPLLLTTATGSEVVLVHNPVMQYPLILKRKYKHLAQRVFLPIVSKAKLRFLDRVHATGRLHCT